MNEDMSTDHALGQRIRALRLKAKLGQQELAAAAGTTQGHISDIESGRRQPRWELVCRIADALGVKNLNRLRV